MTRRLLLLLVGAASVVIVAALVIAWPDEDLRALPSAQTFDNHLRLDDAQRSAITQFLRNAVAGRADGAELPPFPPVRETRVWVSLFAPGLDPLFFESKPAALDAALRQVAETVRAHARVKREFSPRDAGVALKIDILDSLRKLPVKSRASKMAIETGLDGLMLQTRDALVVQPPWDIVTGDWEVGEGEGRQRRRLETQLARLAGTAGRGSSGWKTANLYTFRTVSFIQYAPGTEPKPLFRSLILNDAVPTRPEIENALREAARWIVRTSEPNGRFTYLYYAVADESNFPLNYGVVRHAATVYGLLAADPVLAEPEITAAAQRSLDYMLGISRAPLFAPDLLSVRQYGLSFLGATALGLMSIVEKPVTLRTPAEADAAKRYADFLVDMQMEDGAYYSEYLQKLVRRRPSKQALYFPGESFLALLRYYEQTHDARYLDATKRAARFQIAEFRRTRVADAWCTQALARLALIDKDPEWARACFEMADYYLGTQWRAPEKTPPFPDYAGGFNNSTPPRATPAASRTEALSAGFDLARALGHPKKDEYGDAVLAACRFIMNNQYGPETSYFARNPEKARGGIRGGLVDTTIRVDYNQHSMIAFLGGLRVLADRDAGPAR